MLRISFKCAGVKKAEVSRQNAEGVVLSKSKTRKQMKTERMVSMDPEHQVSLKLNVSESLFKSCLMWHYQVRLVCIKVLFLQKFYNSLLNASRDRDSNRNEVCFNSAFRLVCVFLCKGFEHCRRLFLRFFGRSKPRKAIR